MSPELPAHITIDILGIQLQLIEDYHRGLENVLAYPVTGENSDSVFSHLTKTPF